MSAQRWFSRAMLSICEQEKVLGRFGAMTSWRRVGLGLLVLAAAQVTASASKQAQPAHPPPRTAAAPADPAPPAPVYIRNRISELGSGFDGRVGIAIKSIDEGWSVGWK